MKRYKNIFLMLAVASIASACSEELNPNEINKANPGDEVQFGAALPGVTKTIYGDETETGFPIYWVGGDKVQVASPQCQSGRNNAEYLIGVNGAGQNYATSMTKTGEYGVQWGNTDEADFYSVYPAGSAVLSISGNDVKASLSIARAQTAKPKTTSATDLVFEPEDMNDVVMIAKEKKVPTGNVVNLKYIPFSTVIEFTIPGPTSSESGDAMEIIVQSLTLTAPEGTNIAGDFDFNLGGLSSTSKSGITDLSAENVSNASNSILLHIMDRNNAYAKVTKGQTLKVKMCLVPQQYTSLEGWKVTVSTNEGNYVKTIQSNQLNSDAEKNKLKSGLVHKVTLPALNYKGKWDYNLGDWIQTLPDYENIYLSELSLPGAWYAGGKVYFGSDANQNYQVTSDIEPLWAAGIRAFAIECRSWTASRTLLPTNRTNPKGLCVSGTGYENGGAYCDGGRLQGNASAKRIKDLITELASCVATNNKEYGVLVLSYADGGNGGHRDSDHSYFIQGVVNEIAQSGATNIYTGDITPKTTVEQVKGKLIVVVNVDDNITKGSYANNGNMLINYTPFPSNLASKTEVYFSHLYWKIWEDTYKALAGMNTSDLLWCFSSANRTDCTITTSEDGKITNRNGVVTLSQRKAALKAMGDKSKRIYDASSHNVWFYFNCGGGHTTTTEGDTDAAKFAKAMNPWLLNRIRVKSGEIKNSKGEYVSDPSPLGIVMFNRCTDSDTASYKGPAIIDAIIRMNSKFYLKHAGTSGGNTGGSTGGSEDNTAQNDSSFEDGGEMF